MLGDSREDTYIMDAKLEGNIGRYMNHSCQPNVFVQNVFVDTHDIRWGQYVQLRTKMELVGVCGARWERLICNRSDSYCF